MFIRGGGDLMFLIRNISYNCVQLIPPQDSDIEAQIIKIKWNNKNLNDYNVY